MKKRNIFSAVAILGLASILTASSVNLSITPTVKTPAQVLVALGDSITQGANACEPYAECPEVSWSTGETLEPSEPALLSGSEENTFKEHLEAIAGTPIAAYNNARSFTKIEDLPNQAQIAVTQKAEFITILSGANDLCAPTEQAITSDEDFRKSIQKTLQLLNEQLPKAKIFVASIPNIYKLWENNYKNSEAVGKWESADLCQSMLANPESLAYEDVERRYRVLERLEKFNEILSEECSAANNCMTDEGRVFATDFTALELSTVDYFHPNQQGQTKLANAAWSSRVDFFSRIERGRSHRSSENAPIVEVLKPENNSTVSGSNFRLEVKVQGKNKIERVYADTQLGGFDLLWDSSSELWYLEVDTTLVPNNLSTTFAVVALDEADEVTISERITVTVENDASVLQETISEDSAAKIMNAKTG